MSNKVAIDGFLRTPSLKPRREMLVLESLRKETHRMSLTVDRTERFTVESNEELSLISSNVLN